MLCCTRTGGWNTVHWRGYGWELCTRMVLFYDSGSSRSCHLWINYRCITYFTRFCSYQIQSHKYSTLVMGNFWCLVNMAALLVGCLGGSVPKFNLSGVVNIKRATSGFGLKLMIVSFLCFSGPCKFKLSCGNISKLS